MKTRLSLEALLLLLAASFCCGTAFSQELDLSRGRGEIRLSGGVNFNTDRDPYGAVKPSYGIEYAAAVSRNLAITANYTYNSLGYYVGRTCVGGCASVITSPKIHELTGGLRLFGANSSPLTPYAKGSIGGVRMTTSTKIDRFGGGSTFSEVRKFAFAVGGGVDLKVNRHFGFNIDFHAVKPLDLQWYFRPTAGVYIRL